MSRTETDQNTVTRLVGRSRLPLNDAAETCERIQESGATGHAADKAPERCWAALASRRDVDVETLDALLHSDYPSARTAAARNHKTTTAMAVDALRREVSGPIAGYTLNALIRREDIPRSEFAALADHPDKRVRQRLSDVLGMPLVVVRRLVDDSDPDVSDRAKRNLLPRIADATGVSQKNHEALQVLADGPWEDYTPEHPQVVLALAMFPER